MPSFYGQGIATLQVKEGNQVSRGKQGYSDSNVSSYSITRVYGDGGGVEHCQTRPAGAKTLSILFRL